ncbi:hypothetical protein [Litorisediminicola beolgyonensis]|uniref:Uncharacterized protein n=1 Tax=Litorisediminicola beolgyonensis TaxID=1173614 RepID=A0ABW3ZJG1_9RHOB
MAQILEAAGMISLALGGLSGFVMLAVVDYPDLIRKLGIVDTRRVRQVHLDWIIMGLVMVAVALAAPDLPAPAVYATLFGGVVNPATFIPMAFSRTASEHPAFRAISMISFISLNVGLVWAACHVVLAS